MALGGNLKKQKLIPDKKAESVVKEVAQPRKGAKKDSTKVAKPIKKKVEKSALKKAGVSKAKGAVKKSTKKIVKVQVSSQAVAPQVIERREPIGEDRFISREALVARQEMRKRFASEISALGDKTIQLIAFTIGDEAFALDINHVKEVVATPNAAKVPGMPSYYKGMVNIRGNTVMALDLNEKLGLGQLDQLPAAGGRGARRTPARHLPVGDGRGAGRPPARDRHRRWDRP